jgi:D-beta-D-heptose 7-phosphate kinase/D-beta-D-heptose 1-phosphate adenosyltransferase
MEVKPDILVKGGDWAIDQIIGGDFVVKQGGKVLSLQFHEGRSSTDIIGKILSTKCC